MQNLKMLVAMTCVVGSAMAVPAQAIVYTNNNSTGIWNDPLNWDTLVEPISTNSVTLDGLTVSVTGSASFSVFTNNVSGYTNGGFVNVDNGGVLNGFGNYSLRYVNIAVNSGGTFNAPNDGIRNTITVNAGGAMNGGTGLVQDTKTLTVHGTFSPRGTVPASGTSFTLGGTTSGVLDVKATGKVILDLYANNSSEFFSVAGTTSGTKLLFAAGSALELRPQPGYVPQVGDTFDLWNSANALADLTTLSNVASSITLVGSPYNLDTSAFVSTGVVTVVVPEPASLGLLGLSAMMLLRTRPRR